MAEKENLEKLLKINNKQLQILLEKKAKFGLNVPAHIIIEIEDIQVEIEKLQNQLAQLADAPVNPNPVGATGTRILFLDDTNDWRVMVGGLLKDYGYDVVTTGSIAEARQALGEGTPFGLAIIDVRLDDTIHMDESGITFACALRDEGYKDLPIILLTAFQPKLDTVKKITRHPYKFVLLDKHDIGKHDYNDLMYQIAQIIPPPSPV